jgi:starch-binding outer membrane protein, SusD/RagB family
MKKSIIYLMIAGLALVGLSACEEMFGDYLEKAPGSELPDSVVWNNIDYATYFHNDIYNYQRAGFTGSTARINSSWLDAATDLGETSYPWGGVESSLNVGNYYANSGYSEVQASWEGYYGGIRKVNMFIERINGVPLTPGETQESRNTRVEQLINEARFLRAYFYWELVLRYGGVPLVTKTLKFEEPESLKIPRNSRQECVKFILDELDYVAQRLPETYTTAQTNNGRPTKGTALGYKSRILLFEASPQYNTSNDPEKWKAAMDASMQVISMNRYKLFKPASANLRQPPYQALFVTTAPANTEIMHWQNLPQTDWLRNESPVSWGGIGGLCPTQNLVDMYDMADGTEPILGYHTDGSPIINPASGYDDQNPYANRDPRFYATILYNGSEWWYRPIETFDGGIDKPAGNTDATETSYYNRKYMSQVSTHPITGGLVFRNWIFMRYAEILLNYAEARNEYQGPDEEVYKYLDMVRAREGYGIKTALPRTYTKEQMRQRIQKERAIELCFEEHRWWDVRRWKIAEDVLNRPIMGMKITREKESDTTFKYKYERIKIEDRYFEPRMYLYPIPKTEMYKFPELGNNPGW